MDLRKLQKMLVLAEQGSFSRAARALHTSQPALTRSIQSLEDSLGLKLFERTPHGVSLTHQGRLCLEAAQTLMSTAASFGRRIEQITGSEVGEVRIGLCPVTAPVVGPALFQSQNMGDLADTELKITLTVDVPKNLCEKLLAGELDVFIGNADGIETDHGLYFYVIDTFERGFFCRSDHPLLNRDQVCFQDLETQTVATSYPLPAAVWRAVEDTYGPAMVDKTFRYRSNHFESLLELMKTSNTVVFGCGIAYLDELKSGRLCKLPLTPAFPLSMSLVMATQVGESVPGINSIQAAIIERLNRTGTGR